MVLLGLQRVLWALAILAAVAVIDALIYLFTGRCLVCYRCRSEFRNLPIRKDHPAWELAVGEKYREVSNEPRPSGSGKSPEGSGPTMTDTLRRDGASPSATPAADREPPR
jgi:hypothetical protein